MLKIGDFSRFTRVSIKTLHHYHEIGLFTAAHVDRFTGYRYYTFDQLPRLNRILVLRGLGFSLSQIAALLEDSDETIPNAEALRGMLTLRRAQLQHDIQAAQEKLAQVEIRLAQIEQEGKMPQVEILIKPVEAVTVVGAREVVPHVNQMRERCMALNEQAYAPIAASKLKSDGVSLALYHNSDEAGIDVEMAYVVEAPTSTAEVPHLHELSAVNVAYAIYRGSYDDFAAVGQVHSDLHEWITASSYRVSGACREYYLRPPQSADRVGVMEIQYPIEPTS